MSNPQQSSRILSYARRAAYAAWLPLRGIGYFARSPGYWKLFFGRLLPLSLISLLVYSILFLFAFPIQFAFLAVFHGWGGLLSAIVLTLAEGLVIIQALFEGFFVDECRVDVYDATLIQNGLTDLLVPHRIIFQDAPNAVKRLGKPTSPAVYQPWSIIQIIELIVFLPLNLVPIVGVPAFIMITGTRLGKLSLYRWYQLRGLTKEEQKAETRKLTWECVWFGTVAMILELIPILSFLFLLTTSTGSALWTVKLEEERRQRLAEEQIVHDAVPPAYSDV